MAAAASSAPMMRTPSAPGPLAAPASSFASFSGSRSLMWGSDLEEFLLFVLKHPVDLVHVVVGQLVELLLGPLDVVGREVAVTLEGVHVVTGAAADVAHRHPALLRFV